MKFKTDENLPLEAAATLREAGFDVETIRDEALSGASDEVVASRAGKATVVEFMRKIIPVLKHHIPAGEPWIVQHDRIRFRRGD